MRFSAVFHHPAVPLLVALGAGALIHVGMAPYHYWPFTLCGLALFAAVLQQQPVKTCLQRSYAFGLGLYGAGTSWIYVSISQFGNSSPALAAVLTAVFVAAMALLFIPPFYLLGKLHKSPWALILGFPAVYVLGEWFHEWFLTGFPWLYVGYAFTDTPLTGLAPVLGVYGVSFWVCLLAALALGCVRSLMAVKTRWPMALSHVAAASLLLLVPFLAKPLAFTRSQTTPIQVALVQGNIPQEEKWDSDYYAQNIRIYRELSEGYWGKVDWMLWPEAAIPLPFHLASALLSSLDTQGEQTNTTFFTGIIYDDLKKDLYYNDLTALGAGGSGHYFKQRLVPFGEYVPFDAQLRGVIEFFNLPTSIVHKGPPSNNHLKAKNHWLAPAICYELAFPSLIARTSQGAHAIISVSNNAWFGQSIGPEQHLEMARMRAIETGRYLIHTTNNGITAVITSAGDIQNALPRYQRAVMLGQVYPVTGNTPFMLWGVWPVLGLCGVFWGAAFLRGRLG